MAEKDGWRYVISGNLPDAFEHTQRMRDCDLLDPRSRFTYEACTSSPRMGHPVVGKGQAYGGMFEDSKGERLYGERSYVLKFTSPPPATSSSTTSSRARSSSTRPVMPPLVRGRRKTCKPIRTARSGYLPAPDHPRAGKATGYKPSLDVAGSPTCASICPARNGSTRTVFVNEVAQLFTLPKVEKWISPTLRSDDPSAASVRYEAAGDRFSALQ